MLLEKKTSDPNPEETNLTFKNYLEGANLYTAARKNAKILVMPAVKQKNQLSLFKSFHI